MTSMTSALLTHRFLIFILIHLKSDARHDGRACSTPQSAQCIERRTFLRGFNYCGCTVFASTTCVVPIINTLHIKYEIRYVACRQKQKSTTDLQGIHPHLPSVYAPVSRTPDPREMEGKMNRDVQVPLRCWHVMRWRGEREHEPVFAKRFRRQAIFFSRRQTFCKSFWFMNSVFHILFLNRRNFSELRQQQRRHHHPTVAAACDGRLRLHSLWQRQHTDNVLISCFGMVNDDEECVDVFHAARLRCVCARSRLVACSKCGDRWLGERKMWNASCDFLRGLTSALEVNAARK